MASSTMEAWEPVEEMRRIFREKAKRASVWSIVALLAPWVAIAVAIGSLAVAYRAYEVGAATRTDQLINEAYTLLYAPPGAIADRSAAFQTILGHRGVNSAQLDCLKFDPSGQTCQTPIELIAVTYDGRVAPASAGLGITNSSFHWTHFNGGSYVRIFVSATEFDFATFDAINFENCFFFLTSFYEAYVAETRFQKCGFEIVSFEGAELNLADFSGSKFERVEVTGALLCDESGRCVTGLTPEAASQMWYSRARPPRGMELLPEDLRPTHVCDANFTIDEAASSNDPCLPTLSLDLIEGFFPGG